MKLFSLFACACLLFSVNASAGTENFSDRDPDENRARIPEALIAAFANADIPFTPANDGNFVLSVKNVSCTIWNNGALDPSEPNYSLSLYKCWRDADAEDPSKGVKLNNAGALIEVLGDKVGLTDCAMGRCYVSAVAVNCLVDTKIEGSGQGRFSCSVETEYD